MDVDGSITLPGEIIAAKGWLPDQVLAIDVVEGGVIIRAVLPDDADLASA
ncbi:hypothetical protein [Sphingomonas sp. S6]|jgi:hypothetical protein|nr:hypothetical protein [uncultured Sphingomonas sp.]